MKTALLPLLLLLTLLTSPGPQAAVLKDEALQRLLEQGRMDELEREAKQRSGADALAAQVLTQLGGGDKSQLDAAISLAERCTEQHPQSAACHYALGSALGLKAQAGGLLGGLRLVGRVRDSLGKALELDPLMFEARTALQLVYAVVPAVAGGSMDKARQLELSVRSTQPEVAKLLRARLAGQQDRWDEAERELASIRLGEQRGFQNEVLSAWGSLARQWNKADNNTAKSRALFERLAQQLPLLAAPVYSLGRVAAEEGKQEEALKHYERSRSLSGAGSLPLEYRIGLAYMGLGDRERARQHLQRFVLERRANPSNVDDARKRLKELG